MYSARENIIHSLVGVFQPVRRILIYYIRYNRFLWFDPRCSHRSFLTTNIILSQDTEQSKACTIAVSLHCDISYTMQYLPP
jgi:hypothetical protein